MTTERNKQAAAELFARFSASDIPGVLALMTDEVTWRIPVKPELSPAAGIYDKERLGRLFRRMLAQLEGGLEMTVSGSIAEGDHVAVEVESTRAPRPRSAGFGRGPPPRAPPPPRARRPPPPRSAASGGGGGARCRPPAMISHLARRPLSWTQTVPAHLTESHVLCSEREHDHEDGRHSRLEHHPCAAGRRRRTAPPRRNASLARAARDRREVRRPLEAAGPERRLRLSAHREARRSQPDGLGHDPRRARLLAAVVRLPRSLCRVEAPRRCAGVRAVDAGHCLPEGGSGAAALAVPAALGCGPRARAGAAAADVRGRHDDTAQARDAGDRLGPDHARLLSGGPTRPEPCARRRVARARCVS